ncbi:apiosidase-like domain-containing protein [Chthoniobacter flavus]|uniref:apiosidase-like domain-containing protein n=1 Tax=Chthoniobacter flavus TaxID=191863 RepID=UPI003B42D254
MDRSRLVCERRPFFYLGDTAWELFHRVNRQDLLESASAGYPITAFTIPTP